MCFSAEASFAAGAVLTAGGVWTRARNHVPAQRPLATIPLLLGVQQFSEGVVWVGLADDEPALVSVFSYFFIFFAFFLWPIVLPLSALLVEPNATRKRIQKALLVVGFCVAIFICGSLARHPLSAQVLGGHIAYRMHLPLLYESLALYVAAVSAPCFSSYRALRWFGGLLLLALGASVLRSALEFVSVWCFFAALFSGLIAWQVETSRAAARVSPVRAPLDR